MRDPSTPSPRDLARELRRNQTPAEAALWLLLRSRRLAHLKFRRQVPIGPFVVDFYCHRLRLAVELDGEVHLEIRQAAHDENRDDFLRSRGLRVLRFPNQVVFSDPEEIFQRILLPNP